MQIGITSILYVLCRAALWKVSAIATENARNCYLIRTKAMRFDYRKLLKALAFRLPVTLLYFWVNYSIAPSLSFPSLCFDFPAG